MTVESLELNNLSSESAGFFKKSGRKKPKPSLSNNSLNTKLYFFYIYTWRLLFLEPAHPEAFHLSGCQCKVCEIDQPQR